MGMFMDADGIPLAFSVFDGNQNEQSSMSPLEQKIIKDFEASDFIVCTDAGLSSTANRKFNSIQGRGFVTTQSIKKLKGFLQDFCLEDDGWEIEECFRIMKTEFKARPVYLSRKDRITAHFTTCFTALVIYRILEQKLNEKYTCEELIDTICSMDMLIAPGEGYIPTYTRTDITDALHDAFGFRTDYQITSQKNMRKILNQTKKK